MACLSEELFIGIEIEHESSVTNSFKTHAFDTLHFKDIYGSSLYSIMIYARNRKNITIETARQYCYTFDLFIGDEYSENGLAGINSELEKAIRVRLTP